MADKKEQKQYVYKNNTDQELVLVGVGVVAPGNEIESDQPIENANLTVVKSPDLGHNIVGVEAKTEVPSKPVARQDRIDKE